MNFHVLRILFEVNDALKSLKEMKLIRWIETEQNLFKVTIVELNNQIIR